MAAKLTLALVLCDVIAHGLLAGQLLEATPELVKALAADGSVDPHKDAVAHAKAQGRKQVRSRIELAAEQRLAAIEAAKVELAKLEQALTTATDETRSAVETEVARQRIALAALQEG